MKIIIPFFLIILSLIPGLIWADDIDPSIIPLAKFYTAKGDWEIAFEKAKKKEISANEISKQFDIMMTTWSAVPQTAQKVKFQYANRSAFTMAQLYADQGNYKSALNYLEIEMQNQRQNRPEAGAVLLANQNRRLFQEVMKLEAEVLGHLGATYQIKGIDYPLLPVGLASKGQLDDFVAMEENGADEEYSITIPPFPQNENRKIIYLLAPDATGNYRVITSVQFIGMIGKTTIELTIENGISILTIIGVTHTIELREGIPFKYDPISSASVKLKVQSTGFQAL